MTAKSEIKKISRDSFIEMNSVCMDDIEKDICSVTDMLSGRTELAGIYYRTCGGRRYLDHTEPLSTLYMLYRVVAEAYPNDDGKDIRPMEYYTSFGFPLVYEKNGLICADAGNREIIDTARYEWPYYYHGCSSFDCLVTLLETKTVRTDKEASACLARQAGEKYAVTEIRSKTESEDLSELLDVLGVENGEDMLCHCFGGKAMAVMDIGEELYGGFKYMLERIDDETAKMRDLLRRYGITDENIIETVSEKQRYAWEAEAVIRITRPDLFHISTPDYDMILSEYRTGRYNGADIYTRPPVSLEKTGQTFNYRIICGDVMKVYNDPAETNSKLIGRQGNSLFRMSGTCGICQCGNLATLAGIGSITESRAISAALHCSKDVFEDLDLTAQRISSRGGTTANDRHEILDRLGCPNTMIQVKYHKSKTVAELSDIIRSGRVPIVSVDVRRLWNNGQRGAHAISLISVTEDGSGFIYNDTGAGVMGVIMSDDLAKSLLPSNAALACFFRHLA